MQVGLGDVEVPNLASFLHARALGLAELYPTLGGGSVFGLERVTAPHDGSALAVYDFGVDLDVYRDAVPAPAGNVVHEGVRRLDAALAQLDAFFLPGGAVINACDGVCDPE